MRPALSSDIPTNGLPLSLSRSSSTSLSCVCACVSIPSVLAPVYTFSLLPVAVKTREDTETDCYNSETRRRRNCGETTAASKSTEIFTVPFRKERLEPTFPKPRVDCIHGAPLLLCLSCYPVQPILAPELVQQGSYQSRSHLSGKSTRI